MTTPTKAAPAKAAATPAAPAAPTAPAGTSSLFSNLSITDAALPVSRTSPADNPFYGAMKASADAAADKSGDWKGQGKSVPLPAAAAVDAERYIRQAAESLKCGSTIRFRTKDTNKLATIDSLGGEKNKETGRMTGGTPTLCVDGKPYTGDVVCFFAAKKPRAKPATKATATPATPAAPAAPAASAGS